MDREFYPSEKLYRSFFSQPRFIKRDGTLTKAIFDYTGKGSNGCSVSRQLNRGNEDAVRHTQSFFPGRPIASVLVSDCYETKAHIVASPSCNNTFHSEIYQNKGLEKLSEDQKADLAVCCVLETE